MGIMMVIELMRLGICIQVSMTEHSTPFLIEPLDGSPRYLYTAFVQLSCPNLAPLFVFTAVVSSTICFNTDSILRRIEIQYLPTGNCLRNFTPASRRSRNTAQSFFSASVWFRRKILHLSILLRFIPPHPDPLPRGERGKSRASLQRKRDLKSFSKILSKSQPEDKENLNL